MIKCPKCGAEYNDNTWFCIKCGTMLSEENKIEEAEAEAAVAEEAKADEAAEAVEEAKAAEAAVAEEAKADEAAEPVEEAKAAEAAEAVEEVEAEKPAEVAEEAPAEVAEEAAAEAPAEVAAEAPEETSGEAPAGSEAKEPEDEGMQFTDYRDTAPNFDDSSIGGNAEEAKHEGATDAVEKAKPEEAAGLAAAAAASTQEDTSVDDEVPLSQYAYNYQQNTNGEYANGAEDNPDDSGSIGWGILGFLFPIVGLILFLVWKDNKPKSSKVAGLGALISVIVNVVLTFLMMILFGIGVAVTGPSASDAVEVTEIITRIAGLY